MKETTKSYPQKLLAKTQDLLTHLTSERITRQESLVNQPLPDPSCPPAQQAKGDHPAILPVVKTKKSRIPFIALALVILFASLCALSLVSQQSLAWAKTTSPTIMHQHAASSSVHAAPTSLEACITTDCYGDPATPNALGVYQYQLINDGSSNIYSTVTHDSLTWNDQDFEWADRDITCIYNPNYDKQIAKFNQEVNANFGPSAVSTSSYSAQPSVQATPGNSSAPPLPRSGASKLKNQNTCTDNSTCYSDNRSENDDSGLIHDLTGGDDIICFNNACIGKGNGGADPNCSGLAYDRFACSPIAGTANWYYNPTAYQPSYAVEEPNGNLDISGGTSTGGTTQLASASGTTPVCNTYGQWQCTQGTIYLAMATSWDSYGNPGSVTNPFTGSPEQIANDDTSVYLQIPNYQVACNQNYSNWVFPCSDLPNNGGVNEPMIQNDWFSGDIGKTGPQKYPAHIAVTYADETHALPHLISLSSLTLAIGYTLTLPAVILIGYQLLWSSWTLRRVATMEMVARLLLSLVAVSVSYELTTMLIGLSNALSQGIVMLHTSLGYPDITLNGNNLTYTLNGEQGDPASFRGIVIPISRWGCIMNDFFEILEAKVATDAAQFIPFIGGPVKFFKGILDAIHAFRDIGEFVLLLLNINFAIQVFIRVALVNYYILMAPVALGCWGLPGVTGQRIVGQWFKGLCSVLFTQAIQLFVLTTMPWLLPPIPQLPTDTLGVLYTILTQVPRIVVLMAAIKVPAMLGTGATKAMARAGTVGSGAVTAIAGAAYSVV